MVFQQITDLKDRGIPPHEILYVDFEDERLLEMKAEDLNLILELALEMAGEDRKPYFFLDEIRNVDGWIGFVNRLADMKYRVNIAHSGLMITDDEASQALGKYFRIVPVFPYSFTEYLHALGKEKNYLQVLSTSVKAGVNKAYEEYLKFGAFPELMGAGNKRASLTTVYQAVCRSEIMCRNSITNDFAVRLILKRIAESNMHPLSFSRLAAMVNSAGAGIGKQTVINYVGYMMEAGLLFPIQNYTAKLAGKDAAPKYYFCDSGFYGLLVMNSEAARLENLVAVELVRRYGKDRVWFFGNNIEVDFLIPDENLAIQVSNSILGDEATKEREMDALDRLKKTMPDAECILITNSEEAEITYNGTGEKVVPAWKWLLKK